jgi:hypothetical protein
MRVEDSEGRVTRRRQGLARARDDVYVTPKVRIAIMI